MHKIGIFELYKGYKVLFALKDEGGNCLAITIANKSICKDHSRIINNFALARQILFKGVLRDISVSNTELYNDIYNFIETNAKFFEFNEIITKFALYEDELDERFSKDDIQILKMKHNLLGN